MFRGTTASSRVVLLIYRTFSSGSIRMKTKSLWTGYRHGVLLLAGMLLLLALLVIGGSKLLVSERVQAGEGDSVLDTSASPQTGKDGISATEGITLTVATTNMVKAGEPVELVTTVNTPFYFISWDFGDGSPLVETGLLTVTHIYVASGHYTATGTLYDIYSTPLVSVPLIVDVAP